MEVSDHVPMVAYFDQQAKNVGFTPVYYTTMSGPSLASVNRSHGYLIVTLTLESRSVA